MDDAAKVSGRRDGEWSVQVYGKGFLDPLLDTSDASRIVVRGASGNPAVAIVRVSPSTFLVCDRGESDWASFCGRFGIS